MLILLMLIMFHGVTSLFLKEVLACFLAVFPLPAAGKRQEEALNCFISSLSFLFRLSPCHCKQCQLSFLCTSTIASFTSATSPVLSIGGKHLSCVNWPQWHCSITAGARAISRSKPAPPHCALPHNSNQTKKRPQGPALTAQAGRPNNMASLRNRYTSRCIDWDESMPLRHNTAEQPECRT